MRGMLAVVGGTAAQFARGWSNFGLADAGLGLVFAAAFPTWVPRVVSQMPLTFLAAIAYPALGAMVGAVIAWRSSPRPPSTTTASSSTAFPCSSIKWPCR